MADVQTNLKRMALSGALSCCHRLFRRAVSITSIHYHSLADRRDRLLSLQIPATVAAPDELRFAPCFHQKQQEQKQTLQKKAKTLSRHRWQQEERNIIVLSIKKGQFHKLAPELDDKPRSLFKRNGGKPLCIYIHPEGLFF